MKFESVAVTRPYEQIVFQIEEGIRSGRLVNGQKLPTERELSQQFGVGRGVVREAIKVLDAMGIVESRQGSGIFVRMNPMPTVSRVFTLVGSAEKDSIAQLFEFREELECFAARLASVRRTDEESRLILDLAERTAIFSMFGEADLELHRVVHEASGNPYLAASLAAIRAMQTEVLSLFTSIAGSAEVAAAHHLEIAHSIAEQDADAAADAMRTHIRYTADRVSELLADTAAHSAEEGGADSNERR